MFLKMEVEKQPIPMALISNGREPGKLKSTNHLNSTENQHFIKFKKNGGVVYGKIQKDEVYQEYFFSSEY